MFFKAFLGLLLINFSLCDEDLQDLNKNPSRFLQGKIVNGEPIDIEVVPYYVSIFIPGEWTHYCGGAIIGPKWILSAEHCFFPARSPSVYRVRSGTSRVTRNGVVTEVKNIFHHPSYIDSTVGTTTNDFALLELTKALKFDRRTQAIKLPAEDLVLYGGEEVFVSGHGDTKNQTQNKEFLRGAVVKIVEFDDCVKALEGSKMTDSMICASTADSIDTCQGDSGGPMEYINTGELVGVVSWGRGCAQPDFPGVYAKVAWARSWIKNVTKI